MRRIRSLFVLARRRWRKAVMVLFGLSMLAGLVLLFLPGGGTDTQEFPELWVVLDREDTLTASQVFALPDEAFRPIAGEAPNFGFFPGSAWMFFTVTGEPDRPSQRIVEWKSPVLNKLEVYAWDSAGIQVLAVTGDDLPFASRPVDHRNYQMVFDLAPGEARRVLSRVSSAGEQLMVPVAIWTEEELMQRDRRDLTFRGGYFGLVAFVLLFNLFIYLIIREVSSLHYLLYNLALLLLQASLGGIAFQYLWPGSPYLANVANPFLASVSVYALMRFTRSFLDLGNFLPRVDKVFRIIGYVLVGNAVLSLVYIPVAFQVSVLVVNAVTLVLNLFIIPVAVHVLRRNFRPAQFFLLAFIVLVITVFGFILTNFGVLRNEVFADYGLLIGSAAEVILLSFAIVDRFKTFRDSALDRLREINRLTRVNNEALERKVAERTEEIMVQKQEIEGQKEEILSSIRYAERIQNSLLHKESDVRAVFPDSFVFHAPKDIVSGDFFWVARTTTTPAHGEGEELRLLAVADCTGHGVPGAFMSVLGFTILQESLSEASVNSPGEALAFLDRRIREALQNDQESGVQDGMDICLLAVNESTRMLHYACANHKILVLRHGEWHELAGHRQGVGQSGRNEAYSTFQFQLEEGDTIYAFTDGLKDQFGGPAQRKLKYPGLKDLLSTLSIYPIHSQRQKLSEFFLHWKGDLDQVDDVCLAGLCPFPPSEPGR